MSIFSMNLLFNDEKNEKSMTKIRKNRISDHVHLAKSLGNADCEDLTKKHILLIFTF